MNDNIIEIFINPIILKEYMNKIKKLGLVGLLLAATSVIPAFSQGAREQKPETKKEVENEVIATFEYSSNRQDEYNGLVLQYNVLDNNTIVQADRPDVKFAQSWFYDVNGNGEFDEEEIEALKKGKIIAMHPEFNKKANAATRKVIESMSRKEDESKPKEKVEYKTADSEKVWPMSEEEKLYQKSYTKEAFLNEHHYTQKAWKDSENFDKKETKVAEETIPKELSNKFPLRFIGGLNYSGTRDSIGTDLGVRYGYDEDLFNFAVLFGYQKGLSGDSSTIITPTSPTGLYGKGVSKKSDYQSLGIDAVVYIGNEKIKGLLGIGYHPSTETENKTAQVLRGDRILSSNNLSEEISSGNFRIFTGADFKMRKFRPEINIGIENSKPFFALKTTIASANKYKKK
jgi:hypothetical protein